MMGSIVAVELNMFVLLLLLLLLMMMLLMLLLLLLLMLLLMLMLLRNGRLARVFFVAVVISNLSRSSDSECNTSNSHVTRRTS
jgi:hypothetical protein